MENNNINLLDLGDDILNIIGGYVKKDNIDRLQKKRKMILIEWNKLKKKNIIVEKMKNLKNGYLNMLMKKKKD